MSNLTVVIPCFNDAPTLETAVLSALAQEPRPEVIVVNDRSTDGTEALAESLKAKHGICVLHLGRNHGVPQAMNYGLQLTQTRYVTFRSANDLCIRGTLFPATQMLDAHPELGLSCAPCHVKDGRLTYFRGVFDSQFNHVLTPDDLVAHYARGKRIASSTVIYRTELLTSYRTQLVCSCDWFAINTIAFRYGVAYVPLTSSVFNVSPESYFQRTRNSTVQWPEVCRRVLNQLEHEAELSILPAEALARILVSNSLDEHGWPMWKLIENHDKFASLLSPSFKWRCAYVSLRREIAKRLRK